LKFEIVSVTEVPHLASAGTAAAGDNAGPIHVGTTLGDNAGPIHVGTTLGDNAGPTHVGAALGDNAGPTHAGTGRRVDSLAAATGTGSPAPTAGPRTKVRVTWRARGSDTPQTMLVDRVINCTGPDYNISRSQDPLICSLVSQGLAVSDALSLGLRTGAYGALIDAQGRVASNLYYVGPMLRADHWEATAAQELRGHAERLAGYLSAPVGRMRAVASA